MSSEETSSPEISTAQVVRQSPLVGAGTSRIKYRDIRQEEDDEEPPQRSLADYLPAGFEELDVGGGPSQARGEVAKCPFCEDFEGDEVAVSYHIDQKHLS